MGTVGVLGEVLGEVDLFWRQQLVARPADYITVAPEGGLRGGHCHGHCGAGGGVGVGGGGFGPRALARAQSP